MKFKIVIYEIIETQQGPETGDALYEFDEYEEALKKFLELYREDRKVHMQAKGNKNE